MSIPWELRLGVVGVVWEVVLDEDMNVHDINNRKHDLFEQYRKKQSTVDCCKTHAYTKGTASRKI
jgi:hypothetical protein